MRILQTIPLTVMLFVPALCQAEESCLWMNAATAGGILGGAVTMTVSKAGANLSNARTPNAKSSAGPTSANPAVPIYSTKAVDDAECVFFRQAGPIPGELRIDVRTMSEPGKEFAAYAARCGAHPVPLKAIGNEAAACAFYDKAGQLSEQVVGRVRDRSFVVRLSMGDASLSENAVREKARKAAEQVAGNLF